MVGSPDLVHKSKQLEAMTMLASTLSKLPLAQEPWAIWHMRKRCVPGSFLEPGDEANSTPNHAITITYEFSDP